MEILHEPLIVDPHYLIKRSASRFMPCRCCRSLRTRYGFTGLGSGILNVRFSSCDNSRSISISALNLLHIKEERYKAQRRYATDPADIPDSPEYSISCRSIRPTTW